MAFTFAVRCQFHAAARSSLSAPRGTISSPSSGNINDDPVFAARAIEIGAKGYFSKSGYPNDLFDAIREVRSGGVFLPPLIVRNLAFARPKSTTNRLAQLTPREIEILRLIGTGKSLSEIAVLVGVFYKPSPIRPRFCAKSLAFARFGTSYDSLSNPNFPKLTPGTTMTW
jgi:hypothetical protein